MPKIAPLLGAIALVAIAIALNMALYPAVWEMIGPAPDAAPLKAPSAAGSAEPARVLPAEPAAERAEPKGVPAVRPPANQGSAAESRPDAVAADSAAADKPEQYAEPLAEYRRERDATAAQQATANSGGRWPGEAASPAKSLSSRAQPEPAAIAQAASRLVPVAYPAGTEGCDQTPCRLPPADQVTPVSAGGLVPASSEDQGPIYPSTGTD